MGQWRPLHCMMIVFFLFGPDQERHGKDWRPVPAVWRQLPPEACSKMLGPLLKPLLPLRKICLAESSRTLDHDTHPLPSAQVCKQLDLCRPGLSLQDVLQLLKTNETDFKLMSLQVCNSSYFLSESGTCVKHCPDGEYEVGEQEIGRECKRCPSGFNKCITASYASECEHHLWLGPKRLSACASGTSPRRRTASPCVRTASTAPL